MFRFIFDLITEPLGLPLEWYEEWIILAIIEAAAFYIAYDKVGILYHTRIISGRISGSFMHWVIRTFCFVVIWAIAYGVILIEKWIMENKILSGVIFGIVMLIGIIARLIKYIIQKKVSVNTEDSCVIDT